MQLFYTLVGSLGVAMAIFQAIPYVASVLKGASFEERALGAIICGIYLLLATVAFGQVDRLERKVTEE